MQMLQKYHEALYPTARRVFAKWLPPPDLTLSQWAEANVFLSSENSAEPGKWHAYSYQVGIMDALTDAANEYVTFQKSARVGYTKIINWDIAYNIHQSPCPILVVQPTIEDAQGYSKDEIVPMLRDTPVLVPVEVRAARSQRDRVAFRTCAGRICRDLIEDDLPGRDP